MEELIRLGGDDRPKEDQKEKGVIFLGHIPFGFFEPQMRKFFSQFGTVKRLRLVRNSKVWSFYSLFCTFFKNGHSRHNAYIEFADAKVAERVAEAMDGYIMYERRLVCKVRYGAFWKLIFASSASYASTCYKGPLSCSSARDT